MWKMKKLEGGFFTAGDENDLLKFLNSLPEKIAESAKIVPHKYTFFIYFKDLDG